MKSPKRSTGPRKFQSRSATSLRPENDKGDPPMTSPSVQDVVAAPASQDAPAPDMKEITQAPMVAPVPEAIPAVVPAAVSEAAKTAPEPKTDPKPEPEAAPAAVQKPKPNQNNNPNNKPNQNQKPNQKPAKKPARKGPPKAPPKVVEIAPMAKPASMRRRHWGLLISALLMIVLPLVVAAWYLWTISTDQYASSVGFTVRQEEGGSGAELLSGTVGDLFGGSTSADTDILYAFIQSQEMVARIDERFDMRGHYSAPWPDDAVFSIWPDATIEELQRFWGRIVRVSYDQGSGLMELRVLAFEPKMAQDIARGIVDESQRMINALNEQAREDVLRYAQRDLDASIKRLKGAREALILFRTRTQIVDPETDLQGRLGVVNNLQGQLAQALIDLDVLLDQSSENDPRVKQARRSIEVIRNRIAIERQNVASGDASVVGDDYPTLLAEYEGLVVDRQFAEEGYRATLTALDVARNNAQRQSRYLAAYVQPTLPQSAEFPRRWVLFGLIGLFLVLVWSILALIYYSVRDSR